MKRCLIGLILLVILSIIYGCTEGEYETIGNYVKGEKGDTGASGNITATTASDLTGILVADGELVSSIDQPSGDVVGDNDTQELTNKTLNAIVAKGTWTRSGSWYLPSFQLTDNIGTNGYGFSHTGWIYLYTSTSGQGLWLRNTNDGAQGGVLEFEHVTATPAVNDYPFFIESKGRTSTGTPTVWLDLLVKIANVTNGAQQSDLYWYLQAGGSQNAAMKLTGDGILYVDDSYDIFDEHDDAELLRQGISKGDKQLLLDAGVLDVKRTKEGEIIPNKYSISLQRMVNLLAGGVYQNRDKIDALQVEIDSLKNEIEILKGVK